MSVGEMVDPSSKLTLPPGFRFNPTDEEIMVNYLCPKIAGQQFPFKIIGDVDLYKYDPWVLPSKALSGEKAWYFFSPRDRKYPNGSRPNRVAGSGYWKATGTDMTITSEGKKVGIKKSLVFYIGKAPRGFKTNWLMHEYRILEPQRRIGSPKLDDWVLCRIYEKTSSAQRASEMGMARTKCSHGSSSSSSSQFDESVQLYINDQSFTMNQLNEKPMVQNVQYSSRNNFDWAAFVGPNNTVPENYGSSSEVQFPIYNRTEQGVMNAINYNQDEMYVSAVDIGYGRRIHQEIQSELINQPTNNSRFLSPNASAPADPYVVVHYQNQPGKSNF